MTDFASQPNITAFWPGTNLTSIHDGLCYGNLTLCIDAQDLCDFSNCDISLAQFTYIPNLGGNVFYIILFAILFAAQLVLGIRGKTWGFMVAMCSGLALEVIGYAGRLMLHNNPFRFNPFIIYLVCLTIGPAFFSCAVYLCLARIIVVYGETSSRFRPRTYTIVFCCCDFLALLLQAIGGAIASTANDHATSQTGINLMISGVSFQVFSLILFGMGCLEFFLYMRSHPDQRNQRHAFLYQSSLFRYFLIALAFATLAIFIRSVFRCAELSGGFNGPLANDEPTFMILEGAMISIACILLTLFHPALTFSGVWAEANFKLRGRRTKASTAEKNEGNSTPMEMN